jgi:hypothetical protein
VAQLQPRTGGGAIVLGENSYYDGLGEHEHTSWVQVVLDGAGHVLSRNDQGEDDSRITKQTNGTAFANGTHLDLLKTGVDPKTLESITPEYGAGVDSAGRQLWKVALPIDSPADSCSDASDGTVIVAGKPHIPGQMFQDGGTIFKIGSDGTIHWQITLH